MSSQQHHVQRLAVALTAGSLADRKRLKGRVRPLVGDLRRARWLDSLTKILAEEFGSQPRPSWHLVADRIQNHRPFQVAWARGRGRISPGAIVPEMAPASGAPESWPLPAVTTLQELGAVLRLHADDLGWLTARSRTEHYHLRWHRKAKSNQRRLIEIPKPLLKHAQRAVLRRLLDPIPPHEGAHGFRRGRSVRGFVEPHACREMLLRMDLEEFFPSIAAARVLRVFMTAGYPEPVAQALTRLCTHAVSPSTLRNGHLSTASRGLLADFHLPQGAPSSPALANLCSFRLDCRLAGLARSVGADYTRYADDLLFSGGSEFARRSRRFANTVSAIVLEEGFRPNHRKTRHLRPGQRQQAAGLILNCRPNVCRREFDRLKAILTNCVRFGPESQNRSAVPDFRAHLAGRIGWHRSVNPDRSARLQILFDRITWIGDGG